MDNKQIDVEGISFKINELMWKSKCAHNNIRFNNSFAKYRI